MGAYICQVCDNMFCSHDVNFMYCEKCETEMCEGCWEEKLHEDQDLYSEICGDCYTKSLQLKG